MRRKVETHHEEETHLFIHTHNRLRLSTLIPWSLDAPIPLLHTPQALIIRGMRHVSTLGKCASGSMFDDAESELASLAWACDE